MTVNFNFNDTLFIKKMTFYSRTQEIQILLGTICQRVIFKYKIH